MGYYHVLSPTPAPFAKEGYKGLHRARIFYPEGPNKRLLSLWEKECADCNKVMGISPKFTLDELKEYAALATQEFKEPFEVIYFSEHKDCPHESEYYGVDVTGFGGYSMVGEGFFLKGSSPVCDILISYFTEKLNSYGLFREYEDWRVFHIFKVL